MEHGLSVQRCQAPGGLDLAMLLQRLGLLSQVLQASGSPARTAAAEEAHRALHAQLAAAQSAGDMAQLARGLATALALLRVQARLLRMDIANVRLAMLAHDLKDGAGLRCSPALRRLCHAQPLFWQNGGHALQMVAQALVAITGAHCRPACRRGTVLVSDSAA